MTKEEAKIGAVIYLNSGGPAMTISEIVETRARVCWHANGMLVDNWALLDCLTLTDPTPDIEQQFKDATAKATQAKIA